MKIDVTINIPHGMFEDNRMVAVMTLRKMADALHQGTHTRLAFNRVTAGPETRENYAIMEMDQVEQPENCALIDLTNGEGK